jgi:hypothetical protein
VLTPKNSGSNIASFLTVFFLYVNGTTARALSIIARSSEKPSIGAKSGIASTGVIK